MRINKKQLKTWIIALKSGKYQQTKGVLQDENGYCCLGVACKILISKNKQILNENGYLEFRLPDYQPLAPKWLKKIVNYMFHRDTLPSLNDYKEYNFNQIADLLEKEFIKNE